MPVCFLKFVCRIGDPLTWNYPLYVHETEIPASRTSRSSTPITAATASAAVDSQAQAAVVTTAPSAAQAHAEATAAGTAHQDQAAVDTAAPSAAPAHAEATAAGTAHQDQDDVDTTAHSAAQVDAAPTAAFIVHQDQAAVDTSGVRTRSELAAWMIGADAARDARQLRAAQERDRESRYIETFRTPSDRRALGLPASSVGPVLVDPVQTICRVIAEGTIVIPCMSASQAMDFPLCAICQEAFQEGDVARMPPCFHKFHDNCLIDS